MLKYIIKLICGYRLKDNPTIHNAGGSVAKVDGLWWVKQTKSSTKLVAKEEK